MIANAKTKKVTISARVIRADGQIEDLGIIAETKNPINNLIQEAKSWLQS